MQTSHDVSVRVAVTGNAETRLKSIGAAVRHVGAQIGSAGISAAVSGIGSALRGLVRIAGTVVTGLTRLAMVAGVTLAAGLLGAAYAMARLGKEALNLGAGRIAAEQTLTNILGGAKAAGAAIKDLWQIAKQPGINFQESLGGFLKLKTFKVPDGQAKSILRELANAVALNSGTPEQLSWAMRGVGQSIGKKGFKAEELNQQIFEQAPALRQAFEGVYGPGGPEEWEKRRIAAGHSIADAWARVAKEAEKLPRAVGGPRNAWLNFTDMLKEGLTSLGKGLIGTNASGFLDKLTDRIEKLLPNMEKLGQRIREFGQGFLSAMPGFSVDLEGILDRIVNLDWQGVGERAGKWLVASFAKVKGWLGQLATWWNGSGIGKALGETFAKVKEAIGGIDFARAFSTIGDVFGELAGIMPALVPMVEAIASALAKVPWATIADSVAKIATSVGNFAEKNPQAFVTILGALGVNSALGNPAGQWVGGKLGGKLGGGGGQRSGPGVGSRLLKGAAVGAGVGILGRAALGAALAPEGAALAGALAGAKAAALTIARVAALGFVTAVAAAVGAAAYGGWKVGGIIARRVFKTDQLTDKDLQGIDSSSDAKAARAMGLTPQQYRDKLGGLQGRARARARDRAIMAGGRADLATSLRESERRGLAVSHYTMAPWGERAGNTMAAGYLGMRWPVGGASIVNGMSAGGGRMGLPSIPGMSGDRLTVRHEVTLDAATRAALGTKQRGAFDKHMGAFAAEAATLGGM